MAKLFLSSILICCIVIINGYNLNYRIYDSISHDESEQLTNNIVDSSLTNHRCIPVQAVEEMGCAIATKHEIFRSLFRTVCEQHQLCYACGFAHDITERQCNRMAFKQMKNICLSQNQSSLCSDCFKQRFTAGILLRSQTYESDADMPGFLFECQQQCVLDYLTSE